MNLTVGASFAEGIYAFAAYIVFFKFVGDSKILDYIMPVLKFVIFFLFIIRLLAAIIIVNVGKNFCEMTTSTFEAPHDSSSALVTLIF